MRQYQRQELIYNWNHTSDNLNESPASAAGDQLLIQNLFVLNPFHRNSLIHRP